MIGGTIEAVVAQVLAVLAEWKWTRSTIASIRTLLRGRWEVGNDDQRLGTTSSSVYMPAP
jgi:hypothetical protein